MQEPLAPRWVPVVIATCARCDDPADGWALVDTGEGSYRLDLCERHLGEMLDGARPVPTD
jgi:hypothetical protein